MPTINALIKDGVWLTRVYPPDNPLILYVPANNELALKGWSFTFQNEPGGMQFQAQMDSFLAVNGVISPFKTCYEFHVWAMIAIQGQSTMSQMEKYWASPKQMWQPWTWDPVVKKMRGY